MGMENFLVTLSLIIYFLQLDFSNLSLEFKFYMYWKYYWNTKKLSSWKRKRGAGNFFITKSRLSPFLL